jgi:hypothetical protein
MSAAAAPTLSPLPLPEPWVTLLYVPDEFVWADALHRALDGQPVPPSLVAQPTRFGFPLPRRLSVFPDPRDPAELSHYEEVLPRAKFLVVICSPHSAEAPWVEAQIKAFKRAGGEERIIVLVVESERDAQDLAISGQSDKDWLPAWLRWRLDESGNFRPAEPGEPLILDARPGRMTLEAARSTLLLTLLEQPDSPVAPPVSSARDNSPAAPTRGRLIWALAASIAVVAGGVGAWLFLPKPSARTATAPAAPTPAGSAPAPLLSGPFALEVPPVSAADQVATAPEAPAPEPKVSFPQAPEPGPVTAAISHTPAPRVETILSDEPALPEAEPPVPPSPLVSGETSGDPVLDRWRRMRALGDELLGRRNREAGMIALSEAAEAGRSYAERPTAEARVQLEVARLCYRLGALQRQFTSTAEARASMETARKILQRMKAQGEDAKDRTQLLENIATFLRGLSEE